MQVELHHARIVPNLQKAATHKIVGVQSTLLQQAVKIGFTLDSIIIVRGIEMPDIGGLVSEFGRYKTPTWLRFALSFAQMASRGLI